MNEPTEAMILAGLNAYSSKGLEIDGYETTEEYPSLEMWGDRFASQMRAALVAAQGAAPQASKKSCGPCRRGQHGCCDGNEYLRCECSHGAAPVLPSSGVDEDNLAEVIAIARNRWAIYGTEAEPLEKHVARAVAEWLKGQEQ